MYKRAPILSCWYVLQSTAVCTSMCNKRVGNDRMNCEVVEMVKHNTPLVVGHMERMGNELTKRIYESEGNAVGVKGRPPIKCENIIGTLRGEMG